MLVANYDTVFRYDLDGRFVPVLSHPSCADIHDIAYMGGRLWVTSTRNDLLLGFDDQSRLVEYHNVRTWRRVRECLGWSAVNLLSDGDIHSGRIDFRDPATHEKQDYDEAHVNSMCASPDGGMYVTLGFVRARTAGETGKACVARVDEGSEAEMVYFCEEAPVPMHNLVLQPDGSLLLLDTGNGALIRIHSKISEVLSTWNFPSRYLRGLCRFPDGRLAIGDQNSVLIFDPGAPSGCQRILLSENVRESVHSIACTD